jgi:hypothetical protein
MDELTEMGVYVNNEGGFPVFTLGTKETACGPSALVAGAPFLKLHSARGEVVDVDYLGRSVEILHV